jgi:hypothetical protein
MQLGARFSFVAMISLGCAVGANSSPNGDDVFFGTGGTAGDGVGGSIVSGSGTGGSGFSGSAEPTAGTFVTAGTFGEGGMATAGTFGNAGSGAGAGGTATAGTGGASGGTGGKASGGSAGKATGGSPTAGTGGTGVVVGPYCDTATKSPLPYTVNDGFQPSGWQGDFAAISVPAVNPDACASRAPGSVGTCSVWRFTPNATVPAWAGVAWSKVWDAMYTHPPVCIASGATKVTFQARGATGGEVVTFSAAGAAEIAFTLTNAWQEYSIPLAGVQYNTADDGVDSGFFWKVTPPTPAGAPVTFFVDDLKFEQ